MSFGSILSKVIGPAASIASGGAIPPGVFEMAGVLGSGLLGAKSQKQTNVSQMALAQKQMDFQERMSNTAYRRAKSDLEAAGINPLMVAKLGGASTPSGAMAKLDDPTKAGMQAALSTAQVSSAISNARQLNANARLAEQNADYFDNKPYGSAVLNSKPSNIFFTALLERNPEIMNIVSDAIKKGITTGKDVSQMLSAIISGDFSSLMDGKANKVISPDKKPKPPHLVINPATGKPFNKVSDSGYQKYLKWRHRSKTTDWRSYETIYD